MKINEGIADRLARFAIGSLAMTFAYIEYGVMQGNLFGIIVAVIGAVLFLTSVVGFCPAYKLLGLSTCVKVKDKKKECCGCGSGGCNDGE